MPKTYTYTRAETLLDQVDLFLKNCGVDDDWRRSIVDAVNKRWLSAVGPYLYDSDNARVMEAELEISWAVHSDHATISISTDLPGWDEGAAPELWVLANMLATYAEDNSCDVTAWVRFVDSIRNDPALYEIRKEEVGATGGPPREWKTPPKTQRIPVQDLVETHVTLRKVD